MEWIFDSWVFQAAIWFLCGFCWGGVYFQPKE